jgi:Fe-S-cluster containining protein
MDSPYHLETLKARAKDKRKANKKLLGRLKNLNPRVLDSLVHDLHEEVFDYIDCLKCGNCCSTISPIVINKDIDRISRKLKVKPSSFVDRYLNIDEDDDYVFRKTPCPFLGEDLYCAVYTDRPKACADYPHTDRVKFYQALDLSLKNTETCPAVFEIFEKLKTRGY